MKRKIRLLWSHFWNWLVRRKSPQARVLLVGPATKHPVKVPYTRHIPRRPDYPTMPKRQPCPTCSSWVKRLRNFPTGALYGHREKHPHPLFLVLARR